jgi:fructokinase
VPKFAGIEAGGTKFVCGVGTGPDDLVREEFPTTTPDETLCRAAEFLNRHQPEGLGIGCFGPIDLNRGLITATPKRAWQNCAIVATLRAETGIRNIAFDTDVNAAALGEYRWGAAKRMGVFLYLTVGTGIGGGAMIDGHLLHGLVHPEMGHIRVPHDRMADPFPGACYAHGDCWEGLASGFAIESRWNQRGESLAADHPAWELETHYLSLGLVNLICTFSPEMIVIGGGVAHRAGFPVLREKTASLLNGYTAMPEIVPPALGGNAGVLGAIALVIGRSITGDHRSDT